MLDTGETAPTFELQDQDGNTVSLSDFEGQRVVLYFYPKAGTKGCAIEAQGFRDRYDEFDARDTAVLGVSADPVEDISEFAEENSLPFTLLSDEEGEVASQYDSYGQKEVRGETWEIAFRNTYVIGPDGTIEAVFEDVSPDEHPETVLNGLPNQ